MKLCWNGIFKLSRKSSYSFIYDSLKTEYIWGVSLNPPKLMKYGSTSHSEKCQDLAYLKNVFMQIFLSPLEWTKFCLHNWGALQVQNHQNQCSSMHDQEL